MRRWWPGERGSGTVLTLAIVGAVIAITMIGIPFYMALATRQAVVGAADAAALAAADTASGAIAGEPCVAARTTSAANAARLDRCELDGYVATVVVSAPVLGIRVSASATAGPPGTVSD